MAKFISKFLPELSFAKEHFLKCLLGVVVISAVVVVSIVPTLLSGADPYVVYVADKKLMIESEVMDDVKVKTTVRKGEELKVLGYIAGSHYFQPSLWVETASGVRGKLSVVQLGVPIMAWNSRTEAMESVQVMKTDEEEWKYFCRFADGEVEEMNFDDIAPELPEQMTRNQFAPNSLKDCYMSLEKFEKKYIGNTFEENESKFRPAMAVATFKDTLRAVYPLTVINMKNGKRYTPSVSYDKSMRAVSYALDYKDDRSAWFLAKLPLMQTIIDNPIGAYLIEGTYTDIMPGVDVEENHKPWWKQLHLYALMIVICVFALMWLFLPPALPVLLIGVLMHFRKVFYPLGNKTLILITLCVSLLSTYVWMALMLAWGMFSICLFVYLPLFFRTFKLVVRPLWGHIPHMRCPQCRSLETFEHVRTEVEKEYDMWNKEQEFRKVLGESKRTWKSWTEHTTTYTDGSKKTSTSDHKNHEEITRTLLYDDYDVLYHVTVYKKTHECQFCGELEYTFDNKYKEIDRRYRGQHTTTSTSESVTPA